MYIIALPISMARVHGSPKMTPVFMGRVGKKHCQEGLQNSTQNSTPLSASKLITCLQFPIQIEIEN